MYTKLHHRHQPCGYRGELCAFFLTWYYTVMTRLETKQALNAALEIIGSRGLSGISAEATTLYDALAQSSAFLEDLSPAERRSLVANLRRQGLIEVTKRGSRILVQPTVKAVHRIQRAQINTLFIRPQQRWDGTWRMVSYDIPARHTKQRRLFTAELHRLGFTLVKDSTWFHPYPCFDVISELVAYCGLTQFVMVAEIVRLDESSLRKLLKSYPTLRS